MRGLDAYNDRVLSHKHVTKVGHFVKRVARMRGGGSALPGLVVEKLDPKYLSRVLGNLPQGVVVITGTNGKTTTTKMVVELLRSAGLTVYTNKTGSNFTRGVIAGVLTELDENHELKADIAVLELDEAHATHFIKQVRPRFSLILNVMRDQLDRFGEIDHTAGLLRSVAESTIEGVVLNRDDPLVRAIARDVAPSTRLRYFGLSENLRDTFPSDHDLHGKNETTQKLPALKSTDVILSSFKGHTATFAFGNREKLPVELKIDGVYNVLNGAAALALARMILGDEADEKKLFAALSEVKPAFGRGEAIEIDGKPLEIILVKNPSGFRLALHSYKRTPHATMIAINDNYADGRDMSWLWDVDFSQFQTVAEVSGSRAYDMATRLQYDSVEVVHVDTNIEKSLKSFLKVPGPKRIYCTYTAMLKLRRILSRNYELEGIE